MPEWNLVARLRTNLKTRVRWSFSHPTTAAVVMAAAIAISGCSNFRPGQLDDLTLPTPPSQAALAGKLQASNDNSAPADKVAQADSGTVPEKTLAHSNNDFSPDQPQTDNQRDPEIKLTATTTPAPAPAISPPNSLFDLPLVHPPENDSNNSTDQLENKLAKVDAYSISNPANSVAVSPSTKNASASESPGLLAAGAPLLPLGMKPQDEVTTAVMTAAIGSNNFATQSETKATAKSPTTPIRLVARPLDLAPIQLNPTQQDQPSTERSTSIAPTSIEDQALQILNVATTQNLPIASTKHRPPAAQAPTVASSPHAQLPPDAIQSSQIVVSQEMDITEYKSVDATHVPTMVAAPASNSTNSIPADPVAGTQPHADSSIDSSIEVSAIPFESFGNAAAETATRSIAPVEPTFTGDLAPPEPPTIIIDTHGSPESTSPPSASNVPPNLSNPLEPIADDSQGNQFSPHLFSLETPTFDPASNADNRFQPDTGSNQPLPLDTVRQQSTVDDDDHSFSQAEIELLESTAETEPLPPLEKLPSLSDFERDLEELDKANTFDPASIDPNNFINPQLLKSKLPRDRPTTSPVIVQPVESPTQPFAFEKQLAQQQSTLRSLQSAIEELKSKPPVAQKPDKLEFQVKNGAFCTRILGFGKFSPFAANVFHGNQKTLLYCEIVSQESVPVTADGKTQFETLLRGSIRIYNANDDLVQTNAFPQIKDLADAARRDFYIYFPVTLANLPAGDYRLELHVEDEHRHRAARLAPALRFSVK